MTTLLNCPKCGMCWVGPGLEPFKLDDVDGDRTGVVVRCECGWTGYDEPNPVDGWNHRVAESIIDRHPALEAVGREVFAAILVGMRESMMRIVDQPTPSLEPFIGEGDDALIQVKKKRERKCLSCGQIHPTAFCAVGIEGDAPLAGIGGGRMVFRNKDGVVRCGTCHWPMPDQEKP